MIITRDQEWQCELPGRLHRNATVQKIKLVTLLHFLLVISLTIILHANCQVNIYLIMNLEELKVKNFSNLNSRRDYFTHLPFCSAKLAECQIKGKCPLFIIRTELNT